MLTRKIGKGHLDNLFYYFQRGHLRNDVRRSDTGRFIVANSSSRPSFCALMVEDTENSLSHIAILATCSIHHLPTTS